MPIEAPRGVSIRIYLVDGKPQGLRVVDRAGWTGTCLAFARADYAEARQRDEMRRTGAYVLVGPEEDGNDPVASTWEKEKKYVVAWTVTIETRTSGLMVSS